MRARRRNPWRSRRRRNSRRRCWPRPRSAWRATWGRSRASSSSRPPASRAISGNSTSSSRLISTRKTSAAPSSIPSRASRKNQEQQEVTTIVVVRKGDTAVIAADSLTTFGTTRLAPAYDRHPQKVTSYGDSFLGVAGNPAHHLLLENLLARTPNLGLHGKAAIYDTFRKLHPILKDEAFLNPKEEEDDPYESSQMTVMVANPSGIFAVYSMREVFEFDRFWAIGSGRDFALGPMYAPYAKAKSAAALAETRRLARARFDPRPRVPIALHQVKLK